MGKSYAYDYGVVCGLYGGLGLWSIEISILPQSHDFTHMYSNLNLKEKDLDSNLNLKSSKTDSNLNLNQRKIPQKFYEKVLTNDEYRRIIKA